MRHFLTARWTNLVMLNYAVDPAVLVPHVPAGTELDTWQETTYVSMVGFLFRDTRMLGVPVPLHGCFEEVNLRFYVRREAAGEVRRGVVFIKEIVPKPMVTLIARGVYNENYVTFPMRHVDDTQDAARRIGYAWRTGARWNELAATVQGEPEPLVSGSEAAFITEHYWGYAAQRDGGTLEYRVEHPPWRVWRAVSSEFDCDVAGLYGAAFAECLREAPRSAFVAEGSGVAVYPGVRIVAG